MKNIKIKVLISFICFLFTSNLSANNWKMILKDGSIVKCKKIYLEKDSIIKFIDNFDIERFSNINKIETLRRIKNEKFFDKIITLDTFYFGDIIEYQPKNFISITLRDDSLLFIPVNDVIDIRLSFIEKAPNNSFELGVALGYPAAVNLITGYYNKNFGIRISGSYIYLASGYEVEFKYRLFKNLTYNHFLKLSAGYSEIRKDKFGSQGILRTFVWKYLGLSYEIRYKGLFLDFGLSWGEGDYKIPNLIYKFGYSYFLNI